MRNKNYFHTYIIITVLTGLLIFAPLLQAGSLDNFDKKIRNEVQENRGDSLGQALSMITKLGDGRSTLAVSGLLPDEKSRKAAFRSFLVSGASVLTLKTIIGRKRPPGDIEYHPFTLESDYHSFPSGHTTTSFALATTISKYYPDYSLLAYGAATLIGMSRVYEDHHWTSDVLAGAILGYFSARYTEYRW